MSLERLVGMLSKKFPRNLFGAVPENTVSVLLCMIYEWVSFTYKIIVFFRDEFAQWEM